MKYVLVSVFEREIEARMYEDMEDARAEMMSQLRREFLSARDMWGDGETPEDLWQMISGRPHYNDGWFGFYPDSAYSNLDSSRSCDWKIVPIEEASNHEHGRLVYTVPDAYSGLAVESGSDWSIGQSDAKEK